MLPLPGWARLLLAAVAVMGGALLVNFSVRAHLASRHVDEAEAHLAWGRLDDSLASLETARRLTPGDAEIHRQLGAIELNRYRLQGRAEAADAATEAYLRAAELNPLDVDIKAELAWAWVQLGRDEAAIHAFEAALDLDPYNVYLLTSLAEAQELMGRLEAAAASYRDALAVGDDGEIRARLEALEERLAGNGD